MQAGVDACACPECGVVCQGRFDGCPDVWTRGPRPVALNIGMTTPLRIRALNTETSVAQEPPPRQSPLVNGFSGPSPLPPGGNAEPPAEKRTEVFNWFEDAFEDLRNELHAVVSTVTRQQAMLAELLDTRDAELRVVMLAEQLPELAGEAAAKALVDQSAGLAEVIEERLDDLRLTAEASDQSTVATIDSMRELLSRVETTAEARAQAIHRQGADRLESLKSSVNRQIRPVVAAVAQIGAQLDAGEEREAARNRALKAAVARQLEPLAAAMEAALEHTDQRIADIHERLDGLAAPAVPARRRAKPRNAPPSSVRS